MRSASLWSLLASVLLLTVLGCSDPGFEEVGDEYFSPAEVDDGLTFDCATATLCTGGASGATPEIYSSVVRIGAASTSRGEALQTFKPGVTGIPLSLRLRVRPLRPFTAPAGTMYLHAAISALDTSGASPQPTGTPLFSGQADLAGTSGDVTIPLGGTGTLTGTQSYGLLVWADAVPAGGTGTSLFGLATLAAAPYADGATLRRAQRRAVAEGAWAESRFRPAGELDLAFALTMTTCGGSVAFATPGTTTTTVPDGCTRAFMHLWGAGGAGSRRYSEFAGNPGGGGGYIEGILPVTAGTTLTVGVGGGGSVPSSQPSSSGTCQGGGVNGGGHGCYGSMYFPGSGGGGGGWSFVKDANGAVLIGAGGGGGGGDNYTAGTVARGGGGGGYGTGAGAGAGQHGATGHSGCPDAAGKGATRTDPGSGGNYCGIANGYPGGPGQGGQAWGPGNGGDHKCGGGGGGYFGGGGAADFSAGGGGSAFIPTNATSLAGAPGNGQSPGMPGHGAGGAANGNGEHGYVSIEWLP